MPGSTPFRAADESALDEYIAASLSGFHDDGQAAELSFLVRNPDARWVKRNLLEGVHAETCGDGIRVTMRTSALIQVARFVVRLGEAATKCRFPYRCDCTWVGLAR